MKIKIPLTLNDIKKEVKKLSNKICRNLISDLQNKLFKIIIK